MKHILVYGDSNTWGYDAATHDLATGIAKRMPYEVRWTGRLQQLLGNEYRIIEDALNGRTVMVDDSYFPDHVGLKGLRTALDVHAPLDLVVIHLGVNELKQMFGLSAGMIASGVERLVTEAQTSLYGYPQPKVLVIAPPPVSPQIDQMMFGFNFGPDAYHKSTEFSDRYRKLSERHGCAFIDCAGLGFELNKADGLHYSRADHAKLAQAAADMIREIFR